MATVLYITAHPRDDERSYSMSVGKEFVQAYRLAHPQDEVVHLDLYKMNIPQLDADVLDGWDKLRSGTSFEQLTLEEQTKIRRINELVDQFVAADKYIFATPIWNYSYPPVVKAYLDTICITGKTFKYHPDGSRTGLLGDKKAVHIQASGSVLSPGSNTINEGFEMGHRHLKVIMDFVGLTDFQGIFVEGTAEYPEQAAQFKEKAIQQAHKIAENF
ncbi:FMN-dependent NADH-azoreductase [Shouchella clausii]|nr:FMN-dependent NADH-azoreductase [Shouchella clausii]MBU8597108.1 FMN-dependent NADH-azoreductase [Shouchella clausii]MCY1104380.1 FMN-dependent NADH-azoreductase [Shouchella clausii]MEB5482342.1 FMN-dependent NADH-azoreductase [Shouchella clausii]PAD08710.1 FMN-dependent NADH-azoreductase [Shouchella clausii]PAD13731.1 FMN-dependent NADH-azoreductase [Shouchella clausii]